MADVVKVKKANKVLTILPTELNHYLSLGYDQIDAKGKILKESDKKTYSAAEYNKLLEENKQLKAKLAKKEGKE